MRYFSYDATGEWELINETIKLVYNPFEFQSNDSFSQDYIADIETVYITPAFNGTRRFQYDVEKLSTSSMQIGDDYDSWQCKRNKRSGLKTSIVHPTRTLGARPFLGDCVKRTTTKHVP
ncbi:hypothetical protein [Salinivibrio socompensis]|uniref:hypothetical protein n=1 Tax=Salinivibrio socompensis TaxID=1510206 RepID=UPI00046F0545|nr:hypothetical protein [Salinivibrio socompensis]